MYYKFACGCKFKQLDNVVKDCDGLPPLEIDYYNLPECPTVWPMLASGKTKGVFQLEKSLGKHWCKELYPENIHHLAALASILRPGILESIIDDKSLTQHYCDNKNHRQEVIPMHPALEKILEDTQQIIIFQEQILLIAKEIAGFTGVEADTLRRGIGHKDAKVVFEMEKKFIDGCVRVGKINEQDAKNVFDIIKKSARYSFNASHAYAYGTIGYWTAYTKQHFPLHFYAAYIAHAKDKQDPKEEIKELIDDARNFGVEIIPPHVSSLKNNRNGDVTIEDQKILFGIIDIKGIGQKQIEKLYDSILEKEKELGKDIKKWSWNDFLFNTNVSSTVTNNLILVGATPGGVPRKQKAYEYSIFQNLTEREVNWFSEHYQRYENFADALEKYSTIERKEGGPSNVKRKAFIEDSAKSLKNSPYSTKDHPDWIVANEREYIGIPITYSSTENKMINTGMTCADFLAGKRGKINILVEISSFKEYTIKKGQNAGLLMCVLELKDSTESITGIMFHEDYKTNQEYLFDGNVVLVSGFKSKKDPSCLVINKVEQV
jgi:DNA polymerase III alpha subunit